MRHSNHEPDALPSSRTLLRSTLVALAVAGALLVAVVMPAEYGLDPVGIGRVLGLTEMGRIKMELAREAAQADAGGAAVSSGESVPPRDAPSDAPSDAPAGAPAALSATGWRDSMTVTLAPGKGIELKLAMRKNQKASYEWSATSQSRRDLQHPWRAAQSAQGLRAHLRPRCFRRGAG